VGFGALLERAITGIATTVRRASPAEVFRRADRLRHEGRYAEAAALVAEGLNRSPRSAAGHLLAAYIHFSSRDMASARDAFQRVLAIDPDHPRALLGLARLALEDGHPEAAAPHLRRALQYHPDFPEAAALQEMIASWTASRSDVAPAPGAEGARAIGPEPGSRDTILARADGTAVFADCDEGRRPALAHHVVQIARVAASTLARAGLGALRQGAVEGSRDTVYLLADARFVLSAAMPETTVPSDGLGRLERIWNEHVPASDGRA
jgi:tetratricopeptide (TPR) repeat protein